MCEGRSDQWRFPLPASAQHSSRWEGVWASVMTHTHNELACCAVQYKTGKRKYNSNTNSKVRKPLPSHKDISHLQRENCNLLVCGIFQRKQRSQSHTFAQIKKMEI